MQSLNGCLVNYTLLFLVVWESLHCREGLIMELIELYNSIFYIYISNEYKIYKIGP